MKKIQRQGQISKAEGPARPTLEELLARIRPGQMDWDEVQRREN